jgi:hypothetical protein
MDVSDFKPLGIQHLTKIEGLLNQLYGIRIDWDSPDSHLESVLNNYEDRKALVVSEGYTAMTGPEYGKAVLISEAIRTYLREIAPLRRKTTRRVTK